MSDVKNRCATILPGMGSSSQRQVSFDNVQAAGTGTYTLTFSPGVRCGRWRLRTKGSTADPPAVSATGVTTTSLKVTASDGTRTYTIYQNVGGIGAANEQLDVTAEFVLDIVAVTFVATLITAAGNVDVDFECSGVE